MQEHPTDYPQWEDRVMTGSAGQASLFSLVRAQEKGMKGVQGRDIEKEFRELSQLYGLAFILKLVPK